MKYGFFYYGFLACAYVPRPMTIHTSFRVIKALADTKAIQANLVCYHLPKHNVMLAQVPLGF